jgi:predicted phosphodiesterase
MELEKQKELFDKIYSLAKKKKGLLEISKKLGLKDYEIIGLVELMKQNGYNIYYENGELLIMKTPLKTQDVYKVPHGLEKLKLLLISDTHLGSKYDRLDILRHLYSKAEDKGVKHVLHSGDFTDGRSNRPEQVYELKEPSYEGQVQYCVDKYPTFSGKTYVIQGNHDDWWYKSTGSEIVKSIADKREDIVYLGPDVADLKIGKLKTRLFHGSGGGAYAKSYKVQKYLDSIPMNERPDILQTGHIHQSFYMKQDNTHCFQTSCLEDQTPYTRSKGLPNDKSVWWVDVEFDDRGNVHSITPELETFDKKLIRKK